MNYQLLPFVGNGTPVFGRYGVLQSQRDLDLMVEEWDNYVDSNSARYDGGWLPSTYRVTGYSISAAADAQFTDADIVLGLSYDGMTIATPQIPIYIPLPIERLVKTALSNQVLNNSGGNSLSKVIVEHQNENSYFKLRANQALFLAEWEAPTDSDEDP